MKQLLLSRLVCQSYSSHAAAGMPTHEAWSVCNQLWHAPVDGALGTNRWSEAFLEASTLHRHNVMMYHLFVIVPLPNGSLVGPHSAFLAQQPSGLGPNQSDEDTVSLRLLAARYETLVVLEL